MCGIVGTYKSDASVDMMLDRIAHRGPDGRGVKSSGDTTHGHVRLALFDLTDASAQPFVRGDTVLSYNGELWNYRQLRSELEGLGHTFKTTGDTEVFAASIEQWGTSALGRFDGMFSAAWSDRSGSWLARDRYGKIPLYLKRKGEAFEWSSERKSWGTTGAAALPLQPGTVLDLSTGKVCRWYSVPQDSPVDPGKLQSLIRESVSDRMQADSPVCILCSGGLDSSLVLKLAVESGASVTAYHATSRPGSTDAVAAMRLCKDLGVELVIVNVSVTQDSIDEAIRTIEIESKAQVEIATLCIPLAKRIASDGFKACLSGEGADELFGGYGNMCIAGSRASDQEWRQIREQQLSKMSRGNFVRCNKAFMAAGVECRLPYMSQGIVELAMLCSKTQCPPAKKLLKAAAEALLPSWIVKRQKDTFQGAGGSAEDAGNLLPNPGMFYRAECNRLFGGRCVA